MSYLTPPLDSNTVSPRNLTNGHIRGTVRFQEVIEMVPSFGHPVDDAIEIIVSCSSLNLHLNKLAPQVSTKEAIDRLHMVCTKNPPTGGYVGEDYAS